MNIQGWTHPESCQCRPCYAERRQAVVPEIPELHPEVARGATTAHLKDAPWVGTALKGRVHIVRMPLRERLGRWLLRRLGVGF